MKQDGGLLGVEGLNVEAVRTWIIENGGVSGYRDARYQENGDAAMEEECDILIPAALEVVINLSNAVRIKSPLIIEAANGPVTAGADEILCSQETVIISYMYSKAGAVPVSYFEWVKNPSHIRFGRIQRRQEEGCHQLVVDELERLSSDKGIGWQLSPGFKEKYLRGADELELVRSGLDNTMRISYQAIRDV